ncbi:MAG: hypothetical protein H6815_04270 [Phycisphaeraceae bacterium]|nr:hypothetical protein [Phycisphaerales bacterium]MCB9859647.1 hypothetical protein [Phycisphaeraceae bacterium]
MSPQHSSPSSAQALAEHLKNVTAQASAGASVRGNRRKPISDDLVDGTVPATDDAAIANQNRIACNESSMDEVWEMVVAEMADRVKLSAFFSGARLLSMDDETAKIGLPERAIEYAEHAIDELAQIMRTVTGSARKLTLEAIADEVQTIEEQQPEKPKEISDEELLDHPAIKRAMELFSEQGPIPEEQENDDDTSE